ncbi:TPA: hypothetical protein ACK3JH_000443 [Mannheimia haemolytica]
MRKIKLPNSELKNTLRKEETVALKAAKNMLLQEQKGVDIEQLVQDISLGNSPLLTAEIIAQRIGISTNTLHKWVRNSDHSYFVPSSLEEGLGKMLLGRGYTEQNNATFPKPDLYLGTSPRWTIQTFQNWLRAEITKAR